MTRRTLLVAALLGAAACARKETPLKDLLPVQVQREYVLKETHTRPLEEAPALARAQGLRRWEIAVYRAKDSITVNVFEMGAEASAFEMMQKWNKADGVVFFQGPHFFAVSSADVPRQNLMEFAQDLQVNLKKP